MSTELLELLGKQVLDLHRERLTYCKGSSDIHRKDQNKDQKCQHSLLGIIFFIAGQEAHVAQFRLLTPQRCPAVVS